jgi:hypothetical protein
MRKNCVMQSGGSGYLFVGGDANKFADPRRQMMLYTAPPAPIAMKDHQVRELVNELRDIAIEYHGTQQLRERLLEPSAPPCFSRSVIPNNSNL